MDAFSSGVCQGAITLDEVITRSKNSSDVQTVAPDSNLPEVPHIPSRKRTYHLDHEDLETHVRPLLSCHWHVGRVGVVVGDLQVFSLNKLFSFKTFRSAIEFFDALADIQDDEDHHARVTVDYANVYISTHTHVAYQRTLDADADAKPKRVPGLTLRDVRLAVEVEKLHQKFLGDRRAVTKVPADSASLETWSMEQLRRRYPAPA
ncbi:hypothetical protein JVU11DRAFT_2866 [Chiua virens]|nr:hypothetical protein JVU11DRAFT_2866 [Chiua virens]